jgi:hypothetical protein
MAVKWKNPKTAAKDAEKKYETLNNLLLQYGLNNITKEVFWGQMNQHGYTQADIDTWCEIYYAREQEKEDAKQEAKRQQEGRYGSARATASRDARGPRREEQGPDRQAGQGREGRGQGRQEDGEAQRSWPVGEIWFTLTPEMIDYVDRIAEKRRKIAADVGADNEGRSPENIWRHKRDGYRAEAAARLFFGTTVPWSINQSVTDGSQRIDFSDFIDVKHRPKSDRDLLIRPEKNFRRENAYLLVCGEKHPDYRIVGWCWGHEAATEDRLGSPDPRRPPAWLVKERDPIMKSPYLLRDLALAKVAR